MRVLVFNCGSSSLKFELIDLTAGGRGQRTLAHGLFEEIGKRASFSYSVAGGGELKGSESIGDHAAAAMLALSWLGGGKSRLLEGLEAVAHRVVHGGEQIREAVTVDADVIRAIERASEFAPLHNPPALAAIKAVGERLGPVKSVVVADTAFHQTLPPHARNYPIPRELSERHGIRRFGFHGIGHAWMMERFGELTSTPRAKLNLVTLQLGAGCSATAIKGGRSVDTSMGMTPLEGLMMTTRSGDLDPAIVPFLAEKEHKPPAEIGRILNQESGLLGVSGVSSDMREVEAAADKGSPAAELAIEMFCYRARKYVGAYLAALGFAHGLVFGGGIGEHADRIRARICSGLQWLGIELDPERNRAANGREDCISTAGSRIKVYVIPLDEELYIARATVRLLSQRAKG